MMTKYKGYTFEYHHKFKKEFKKIFTKKHCPTIKSDFQLLYDILINHLEESGKFSPHVCRHVAGLDNYVSIPAFIVKNFRCQGINKGSRSGFRITFLFDEEKRKFIFVEFFEKSKKEVPNKKRINDLFRKDIKVFDELYGGEETYLNSNLIKKF